MAAHVTNMNAAACLDRGTNATAKGAPLYSIGALNYFEKFDITKYEQQLDELKEIEEHKKSNLPYEKELIDFGLVDLSFAVLPDQKLTLTQRRIEFNSQTTKQSKKLVIKTSLEESAHSNAEYGFFGRIKPYLIEGDKKGFETTEVFYGGLKIVRKIGHYYEFELPHVVRDHTDFKGTSGAPIMSSEGKLIALVTHGYEGAKYVYESQSQISNPALKPLL